MEGLQKGGYGALAHGRVDDDRVTAESFLRIVLAGRTGCGKSATGNSILGRRVFESRLAARPVTRECRTETGSWEGRRILVVDTPPIFEAEARTRGTYQDIGDCYRLAVPGPHVLLLVTQLGRFTAQDAQALRGVQEVFGARALRHAIVLFTHREDLDGGSLQDYVTQTDNQSLRQLVRECGGRYCGFNNRATGAEQAAQLAKLMATVEQLERELPGAFLRNELFAEAELLQLRGGGAAGGWEHGAFLAKVRAQVEKHKQELSEAESSGVRRGFLRALSWVRSRPGLAALLGACLVILVVIFIYVSAKGRERV